MTNGADIIFASCFTIYPNPQGDIWHKNNINAINPLYDSVKRLDLDMIIFHDQLSVKFIRKYTTDKIRFEKYIPICKIPTMARFHCYMEHLKHNVYETVLCLDCGDLELYKDPFPLIDDKILIGSEEGLIGDSVWMNDIFLKVYKKVYYSDRKILNCGILGGSYNVMSVLLNLFYLDTEHKKSNVDMAVFNKLVYEIFKYKTGFPIHTIFGKNEGSESGCYIRHK